MTLAREADADGTYAVADATTLPIGDGAAMLLVAFSVLHEIAHLREVVAETARVLAAEGEPRFAIVHSLATAGDFAAGDDDVLVWTRCESFARTHFHRPLADYVAALATPDFWCRASAKSPPSNVRQDAFRHFCTSAR